MSWFSDLVGFSESHAAVHANLTVSGASMTSAANGRTFGIGTLTTPSLKELRAAVGPLTGGRLQARQVVADVTMLHQQAENVGALFQVASQFNLLEMVGPHRTPEDGVTGYAHDRTQGPACAMAAGPATIYRNYFAPVGSQRGQSVDQQLDMLAELGALLGNTTQQPLWTMRNGYALCSAAGLDTIRRRLASLDEASIDALRGALRIGVHRNVEVTTGGGGGPVTQAFCSALPVAYSPHGDHAWAPFAQLVLEASYEATLLAALENAKSGGSPRVFLTLLGGGAFGNRAEWILQAIHRALQVAAQTDLDVRIVSYGRADPMVSALIDQLQIQ